MLIAEDEPDLAEILAQGLRAEGIAVDVTLDGDSALEYATTNRYDVCVLDRDLPALHGDEVCRMLVAGGAAARVLMLTAADSVSDRVAGLGIGADDYLTKPFAFAELVARIRALARRANPAVPPVLAYADVTVDPGRRTASRAGRPLPLTLKELGVLEILIAAAGVVVSSEELLERVWDAHTDPFTNTVRVTVMRLRRKLGEPPLIETIAGAGYRARGGG